MPSDVYNSTRIAMPASWSPASLAADGGTVQTYGYRIGRVMVPGGRFAVPPRTGEAPGGGQEGWQLARCRHRRIDRVLARDADEVAGDHLGIGPALVREDGDGQPGVLDVADDGAEAEQPARVSERG